MILSFEENVTEKISVTFYEQKVRFTGIMKIGTYITILYLYEQMLKNASVYTEKCLHGLLNDKRDTILQKRVYELLWTQRSWIVFQSFVPHNMPGSSLDVRGNHFGHLLT